jgi:molecular chaperone DnaJ
MDPYDLLGVRRAAAISEIRRAYQKLARLLHPDLNPGDPVAAERFRMISEAFEILSSPDRRALFDRGELPSAPAPRVPEIGFEGFDFSERAAAGREAGFRELFDGGLAGAAEDIGPAPGEDLVQTTRISFEESLAGAVRRVQVVRLDHCPMCQGAGEIAFQPATCPRCHGTGRVRATRRHMVFMRRCIDCDASGQVGRRRCSHCGGEGRVMRSEWLEVHVPPGVGDGTKVPVPGFGNAGKRGGTPGTFFLQVAVDPHPVFRREGDDLVCEIRVSLPQAALGGPVEIPTPEGSVTVELPAGTQPGQRFRLPKRGVPRLGQKGRGHLFAEVRLQVPAVTDARGRALLSELAELYPAEVHAGPSPTAAEGKGGS